MADRKNYRTETFSKRHDYTPNHLLEMLVKLITYRHSIRDLRLVLRAGVDLDGDVGKGLRPLHYAAFENYTDCIDLLISYGADKNVVDQNGFTPLHIAARYGKTESVKGLLDHGAITNFVQSRHCKNLQTLKLVGDMIVNPITLALEHNHIECVKVLLEYGAYVNAKYYNGYEISLVPPSHTECVELLVKKGANADAFARSGLTLLMRAAKHKSLECVQCLLKLGADVNLQCPPDFDRKTALHFSAGSGDLEVCTALLDAGANLTCPVGYPHSPLEESLLQEHLEVMELLLQRGANPNELVRERISLLQIACTYVVGSRKYDIAETLMQYGADPNYHNEQFLYLAPSLSPLIEYFSYSESYDFSFVRLLLQHGARVNFSFPTRLLRIKDAAGILAQVHKIRPYEDIMQLLVSAADYFNMEEIKKEGSLSNGQQEMLLHQCNRPRSLRHLGRTCIRFCLRNPVPNNIPDLPLPSFLKQYLLFMVL